MLARQGGAVDALAVVQVGGWGVVYALVPLGWVANIPRRAVHVALTSCGASCMPYPSCAARSQPIAHPARRSCLPRCCLTCTRSPHPHAFWYPSSLSRFGPKALPSLALPPAYLSPLPRCSPASCTCSTSPPPPRAPAPPPSTAAPSAAPAPAAPTRCRCCPPSARPSCPPRRQQPPPAATPPALLFRRLRNPQAAQHRAAPASHSPRCVLRGCPWRTSGRQASSEKAYWVREPVEPPLPTRVGELLQLGGRRRTRRGPQDTTTITTASPLLGVRRLGRQAVQGRSPSGLPRC